MTPLVVSVQVGRPEQIEVKDGDWMKRPWTTAFRKEPVAGPVRVTADGLEGDVQADLESHGGPERAVLAYAAAHYAVWREELGLRDMAHGGFGENLTVSELSEAEVCIGDGFRVGSALLQVAQPRSPCWKIARRWQVRDLGARVHTRGWTGWFFRVMKEGTLASGDALELVERPYPAWSVARVYGVMYHRQDDRDAAAELAGCALLAPGWRRVLAGRAA